MTHDVTTETYDELATHGSVLLDVWGPDCRPCLALMPEVERLAGRYEGRVTVLRLEAPPQRALCRALRVAGLPTYITMRDGQEVERLTGSGVTADDIEAAIGRLLGGAPITGLPVPEHLRGGETATDGTQRQESGRPRGA
jgi:thioredoxin 1